MKNDFKGRFYLQLCTEEHPIFKILINFAHLRFYLRKYFDYLLTMINCAFPTFRPSHFTFCNMKMTIKFSQIFWLIDRKVSHIYNFCSVQYFNYLLKMVKSAFLSSHQILHISFNRRKGVTSFLWTLLRLNFITISFGL